MHRRSASTRRRFFLPAVLLLLLFGLLGVTSLGEAEVAAPPPARTPPAQVQAGPYSAHEWGVWRMEDGRVTHLEELRNESPPFVVQVGGPQATAGPTRPPRGIPVIRQGPVVAFKPVIFFYADRPTPIEVTVGFPGGQPWLSFPAPTASQAGGPGGMIRYRGRLAPSYDPSALPPVDERHFWGALRGVGATPFVPDGATIGQAERFIFYDGPVRFSSPLRIDRRGRIRAVGPSAPSGSSGMPIWVVAGGQFQQHVARPGLDLRGRNRSGQVGSPIAELDGRLELALRGAGLTGAEARSLLTTWGGDLHASRPHAVYLLPRSDYDRMLPITITPPPRELIRVGLVIHLL